MIHFQEISIRVVLSRMLSFSVTLMYSALICVPILAQAQGLENPLQATTLQQFLEQILTVVIQIGYLVAVFFFVYSGFKFVTAQGNDSEITAAKKMLLWTVIGTAILIGAHVISAAIKATVDNLAA